MPILDPVALGVTPCACGRLSNKTHCPYCGSYTMTGTARHATHFDRQTGKTFEYTVYKCRRCSSFFDDWQWRNECVAPQYLSKALKNKQELKAQPMAPAQLHAINKLRADRGMGPVDEYGEELKEQPKLDIAGDDPLAQFGIAAPEEDK